MLKQIVNIKFLLILLALINLVLTPFVSLLFVIPEATLNVINLSLVVFASLILSEERVPTLFILLFGLSTLFFVWCEYFNDELKPLEYLRLYSSCFLFIAMSFVLIRSFLKSRTITGKSIMGAMAGYILLGLLGGATFEIMECHHPDSIRLSETYQSYDFYYYSFISLVTVGFGDITPVSSAAKSLTIFLSIAGQLYMAVGIASFVGKSMSR